jgi:hypothetical protein
LPLITSSKDVTFVSQWDVFIPLGGITIVSRAVLRFGGPNHNCLELLRK